MVWHFDVGKVGTTVKWNTDSSYTIGNGHTAKGGAPPKSISFNCCYTVWNGHTTKGCTLPKNTTFNCRYSIGDFNTL